MSKHQPVLLKEVIEVLNPQPGEFFIDGTVGGGGHAAEIFERILPNGILLGIDWNKDAVESAREKILASIKYPVSSIKQNLILMHGNYADLPEILQSAELRGLNTDGRGILKADGLLLDLGFSSETLESGRGFSFLKNEPLDMRYDTSKGEPADIVLNYRTEKELADIFWKYGEERFSGRIAKKIIEERKLRPIKTTFALVKVITSAVPRITFTPRIHHATRVFQALRIYVNNELGNLEKILKNLDKIVKGRTLLRQGFGGRVAIISFHSLEDRIVKNYFRDLKGQGKAEILTKKPIRPSFQEVRANPRSRSAKLRAICMM